MIEVDLNMNVEEADEVTMSIDDIDEVVSELDKDKKIVVYCKKGQISGDDAELLEEKGYGGKLIDYSELQKLHQLN